MANITGDTSVFPNGIDKLPNIDPYTSATPGNWGDFITPQYVNHLADGVYTLTDLLAKTSDVSLMPTAFAVDSPTAIMASGSVTLARFCVEISNLYLLSMVYSPDGSVIYVTQDYQVIPLPSNIEAALGDPSVRTNIIMVSADMRPKAPVHSMWNDSITEIYPYATLTNGEIHFRLYTPTPGTHINLGSAYVSFEVMVSN
jgi:hypothetical protein